MAQSLMAKYTPSMENEHFGQSKHLHRGMSMFFESPRFSDTNTAVQGISLISADCLCKTMKELYM